MYYEHIHGPIDEWWMITAKWMVHISYLIKTVKTLVDTWISWKKKTPIESCPFYVLFLHDLSQLIPFRMSFLLDWMNSHHPAVSYCFISVVVCGIYFLGRMVAIRAVPSRRVTTALFPIQFMTDVVTVKFPSWIYADSIV